MGGVIPAYQIDAKLGWIDVYNWLTVKLRDTRKDDQIFTFTVLLCNLVLIRDALMLLCKLKYLLKEDESKVSTTGRQIL